MFFENLIKKIRREIPWEEVLSVDKIKLEREEGRKFNMEMELAMDSDKLQQLLKTERKEELNRIRERIAEKNGCKKKDILLVVDENENYYDWIFKRNIETKEEENATMNFNKGSTQKQEEKKSWEKTAKELWKLLDSIDTLPDMVHPQSGDDYEKVCWGMVERANKRFNFLESDGYELTRPGRADEEEYKTVECPNCQRAGWVDPTPNEMPTYKAECPRCDGTGELKVKVEYCPDCGEELLWNDMDFSYDEETDTVYRCINECPASIVNRGVDEEEDPYEDETHEETKLRYTLADIIRRGLVGNSELNSDEFQELYEFVKDLKQQLEEEKRLHQKCRDGLEGWNPPAKKEINRLLKENEGLKQQVEWRAANEKALREELVNYSDEGQPKVEEKVIKIIEEVIEQEKEIPTENNIWLLRGLIRKIKFELKDQQPEVEEILAELSEYNYKGSVSMRAVEDILKKHL